MQIQLEKNYLINNNFFNIKESQLVKVSTNYFHNIDIIIQNYGNKGKS